MQASPAGVNSSTRVVVLGVGNVLMSDEGFGVHVIRELAQGCDLDEGVEIVDGGTAGMELLPELNGIDLLIVVDAVRFGGSPAAFVRLEGDEVPALFKTKLSPHQVGLSDLLAALTFAGSAPSRLVLIGIEPVALDMGMDLSPEVKAHLNEAVSLVVAELAAKRSTVV